jgi:hypothetical protein
MSRVRINSRTPGWKHSRVTTLSLPQKRENKFPIQGDGKIPSGILALSL